MSLYLEVGASKATLHTDIRILGEINFPTVREDQEHDFDAIIRAMSEHIGIPLENSGDTAYWSEHDQTYRVDVVLTSNHLANLRERVTESIRDCIIDDNLESFEEARECYASYTTLAEDYILEDQDQEDLLNEATKWGIFRALCYYYETGEITEDVFISVLEEAPENRLDYLHKSTRQYQQFVLQ